MAVINLSDTMERLKRASKVGLKRGEMSAMGGLSQARHTCHPSRMLMIGRELKAKPHLHISLEKSE